MFTCDFNSSNALNASFFNRHRMVQPYVANAYIWSRGAQARY